MLIMGRGDKAAKAREKSCLYEGEAGTRKGARFF